MKHIYKNYLLLFLIFLIIFLLFIFYIFDKKNIKVQYHLENIYLKNIYLKKLYKNYINNNNFKIIEENNIIIIENILNPDFFNFLKIQFNDINIHSKNYVFRKGSGLDFFKLHDINDYNGLLELYYSYELTDLLSNIFKKNIQKPSLNDENLCSLLIYSKEGDFIDWHKDYSNYYGDRYVCLLTLVNENKDKNGLSNNEFIYKFNNLDYKLKMKENSLVIFKGSDIFHKSTPIKNGEKRILLSMVFCDICQEKKNIINFIYQKFKNSIIYN